MALGRCATLVRTPITPIRIGSHHLCRPALSTLLLYMYTYATVPCAALTQHEGDRSTTGPQPWSYVVTVDTTTNTASANGRDTAVLPPFHGPPSMVLNAAVRALPHHGGTVFLTAGTYVLDAPVVIDRSSVEIRGENMGGDLFFASDGYYNGFINKTATVIVAEGFDAFRIGDGTDCRTAGKHCLILGTALVDLGISGLLDASDAPIPQDQWTNGSGVRVFKADTIRTENLDIRRKQRVLRGAQRSCKFIDCHMCPPIPQF